MIYFLDNSLQLQKIVTSKNVISAIHEHELNGLIRADVELDLSYANKFLVLGIDHVGYYYKDEFYLHKIQRVEYDHVNESVKVVFRHIFFEDMLFGPIIKDVRPKNQDAVTILRQTIEANTRWQIVMTDVTGTLSTNFYWQVPYEVIEFVNKNFRVDMFPKILFDGKNINGFQLHVKNASSSEVKQRIPFGSRVLDLKYEEDFSEIVTKLVGHGKGEEVGDGYGRRINFSEINFNRNGVKSPVGSVYMEDPSVTNTYGNDGQTPREGRVVFEDIESPSELAEATYQHYLDVSRPQMLFTADVADIGDVSIGDSVLIVRREYDVYFKARIHKLSVNLLNPKDAQVELGDYEHFKESKVERKSREKNNRVQKQLSDRIARLKREANDFIDGEFSQALAEFEQNLIDQQAQIEADRENMTNLIEGTRTEFTDNLNAEITQTKEYAEQQAQAKAEAVRTDLGAVTSGHQSMLRELELNVINIEDYLGDVREIPLDQRLLDMTQVFDERINNIREGNYNIIRGSSLDESSLILLNGMDLITDERINYVSAWLSAGIPYVRFLENITLEAGKQYTLSFDYRTDKVPEMDVVRIHKNDGTRHLIRDIKNHDEENIYELTMDNEWHRAYIRFTPTENITGQLDIGSDFTLGNTTRGILHIRLPYLTTTGRTQWLFHPLDTTQNVEEVSRRLTQLEDGYSEMIVRSEWDSEMNALNQTIRDYQTTVDGVEDTIIQLQDSEVITRGREVIDAVDGFSRKVWLGDIDRPNLIPHADVLKIDNRNQWVGRGSSFSGSFGDLTIIRADALGNYIGMESPGIYEYVSPGKTYTLSWEGQHLSSYPLSDSFEYIYLMGMSGDNIRLYNIQRTAMSGYTNRYKYTATFEMPNTITENTRILFGVSREGESGGLAYVRFGKPKLELGNIASPFETSFSMLEQRSDEISLAVQGLDFTGMLTQSDIRVEPGYVQLGSQRLGDSQLASIFRVSPNSIDAITSNLNLSGNLNTNGQITSLAVDAIEGNFARLFASQLTANVITADHIQVGTALIDKMFATSARIDELITKTHFVNEMHALTLNVVDLNASQIRTRLLSANTIEAEWLKGGTALLDKVFASTAMFERMMAKSGFVTTLNTVTIDTDQITIRRPDGGMLINNGVLENTFAIQFIQPRFEGVGVEWSANYYKTTNTSYTTAAAFSYLRGGRYLTVEGYCEMRGDVAGAADTTVGAIRLLEYSSGSRSSFTTIESRKTNNGNNQFFRLRLDLGVPQYEQRNFYVQFYTAHSGNAAYFRINQAYYHG